MTHIYICSIITTNIFNLLTGNIVWFKPNTVVVKPFTIWAAMLVVTGNHWLICSLSPTTVLPTDFLAVIAAVIIGWNVVALNSNTSIVEILPLWAIPIGTADCVIITGYNQTTFL